MLNDFSCIRTRFILYTEDDVTVRDCTLVGLFRKGGPEEAIMLPIAKHNLLPRFKSVRSHWLIRSVPGRGTGKCNDKRNCILT